MKYLFIIALALSALGRISYAGDSRAIYERATARAGTIPSRYQSSDVIVLYSNSSELLFQSGKTTGPSALMRVDIASGIVSHAIDSKRLTAGLANALGSREVADIQEIDIILPSRDDFVFHLNGRWWCCTWRDYSVIAITIPDHPLQTLTAAVSQPPRSSSSTTPVKIHFQQSLRSAC